MVVRKTVKKVKALAIAVKRRNPYALKSVDKGIALQHQDSSFDPTRQDHTNRTYLITVEGQDTRVEEVNNHADDMALVTEDKHVAKTSKPLIIEGNHFYFTKDGFVGTMALNEDTLIGGDVYDPTKETYERKVPVEAINEGDYPDIDFEDKETEEINGISYYVINRDDEGDIALLHGSKKTTAEMNKAKRMRALLEPQSLDKSKLLMTLGSGVALGYMVYPQIQ